MIVPSVLMALTGLSILYTNPSADTLRLFDVIHIEPAHFVMEAGSPAREAGTATLHEAFERFLLVLAPTPPADAVGTPVFSVELAGALEILCPTGEVLTPPTP